MQPDNKCKPGIHIVPDKPAPTVVTEMEKPQQIPPEIAADPMAKRLYIEAYGIVKKTPGLKELSSSKRIYWIQGFINGANYMVHEFEQATKELKDE